MEKEKTCCFFGHRKIELTDELENLVYNTVEDLIINKNVNTFLFGSKSNFDDLCHMVVTKLKEKYPHIQRVYVRAVYPYISDSYKDYLLESFEDTYYPQRIINAGRVAYVERNYEMIDKSSFCVVYYNENYVVPKRKISNKNLMGYQSKSGTKLAYDYAVRKCLIIKNVF